MFKSITHIRSNFYFFSIEKLLNFVHFKIKSARINFNNNNHHHILMHVIMSHNHAVMAAGNTTATEGHIPKLQPSSKLHEPGPQPEPPRPPVSRPV